MHLPGRVRPVVALGLAWCVLITGACLGGDGDADAGALAERWLRVGEDYQTNVLVFDKALPPTLNALLNPGAHEDTPDEDLVQVPVHPDGDLLGSYLVRRTDGVTLVWLFFDVTDTTLGQVTADIAPQLDASPWQVISQQASRSFSVIEFQSTRSDDVTGTAIVQPSPSLEPIQVTVDRGGSEETLDLDRAAMSPLLEAELSDNLTVDEVDAGLAQEAGLQEDDRVIRVGDTDVSTLAELAAAMEALAAEPSVISVTYLLEVAPGIAIEPPVFVEPSGLELPDEFPLVDAFDGLIVEQFQTFQDPTGEFYAASLLSRDSTADVADQIREGLEADGWTILADEPVGFATSLQFANAEGDLQGAAQVDTFAGDEGYVQAIVQIQSATPTGN